MNTQSSRRPLAVGRSEISGNIAIVLGAFATINLAWSLCNWIDSRKLDAAIFKECHRISDPQVFRDFECMEVIKEHVR